MMHRFHTFVKHVCVYSFGKLVSPLVDGVLVWGFQPKGPVIVCRQSRKTVLPSHVFLWAVNYPFIMQIPLCLSNRCPVETFRLFSRPLGHQHPFFFTTHAETEAYCDGEGVGGGDSESNLRTSGVWVCGFVFIHICHFKCSLRWCFAGDLSSSVRGRKGMRGGKETVTDLGMRPLAATCLLGCYIQ